MHSLLRFRDKIELNKNPRKRVRPCGATKWSQQLREGYHRNCLFLVIFAGFVVVNNTRICIYLFIHLCALENQKIEMSISSQDVLNLLP